MLLKHSDTYTPTPMNNFVRRVYLMINDVYFYDGTFF